MEDDTEPRDRPLLDSNPFKEGKRAQVEGDPRSGFRLEFVRGADLKADSPRPVHVVEIGRLRMEDVDDGPATADWKVDTQAVDTFEEACRAVPPPAPSLRGIATSVDDAPRQVEIRDCQWRITKVVQKLVEDDKLLPPTGGKYEGQGPVGIMERAPKHA